MVNVFVASFSASDPGTPFEVRFPSTPAGWRPDTAANTTLMGAVVEDVIATLPQTMDDQEAAYHSGGLVEPLNVQMDLWRGGAPTALALPSFGELVVADPADRYARMVRQSWRTGRITLERCDWRNFEGLGPFARLSAVTVLPDRLQKRFQVRDLGWLLNTTSLHAWRYSGAGDYDGDPAIRDHVRPLTFGTFFNAAPKLINAQFGIYQVTVGALIALTAVRDGGNPLTIVGDFPDFATLKAAALEVNEVATCLALGLLRIGGTPQRTPTCDGTARGTYTTAGLMNALVSDFGVKGMITPLDAFQLAFIDSLVPGEVNLWLPNETTIGAAISMLVRHAELPAWVELDGTFRIARLRVPEPGVAVTEIPAWKVLSEPQWEIVPPRRGTRGGWRRNWTVQSEGDLAAILSLAEKRLYGEAMQPLELPSPAAGMDGESQWVDVPSLFVHEADARRALARSNELFGVTRRRAPVRIALPPSPEGPGEGFDGESMGFANFTLPAFTGAAVVTPIGFAGSPHRRDRTVTLWGQVV
jgi:hypothetical protein